MLAYGVNKKQVFSRNVAPDAADNVMITRMRLLLAVSVLLTVLTDFSALGGVSGFAWGIFFGYLFHSILLYILTQSDSRFPENRLIHWLDICWYALIVSHTGGVGSIFFLFFFFAILASSFRFGFEEGARITIASSALFIVCGLLSEANRDLPRLLMRATFLLALGYMSAHWGESKVVSKRRLALLRDVSRLSNPRFGVDHTVTSVLEKIRTFFKGGSCILVLHDNETEAFSLRTVKEGAQGQSIADQPIDSRLASSLMVYPQSHIVFYSRPLWSLPSLDGSALVYDYGNEKWARDDGAASEKLAELLEAYSFIGAPLSMHRGEGRIYVISPQRNFVKEDALFLSHIVAQAFPVIDNIELLDRIASEAAAQERKKIAWDLHDTAIQPYIGLRLGLAAVRNKANADNPLVDDLDRMLAMATQVVDDLRRYAGAFRSRSAQHEPVLLEALRRKAAQVKEFHGIEIAVVADGTLNISDRLAAEVLHLVSEGLSNICRHTAAQRGVISILREQEWLRIRIENEGTGASQREFTPRSITARAAALGGKACVEQAADGGVAVHIDIPI